jgi:large exoprotein involved in heme utilization and adhesion
MLGGEVRLDGTVIESPGTQVELGSLAVPGVVELNEDLSFIFPEGAARGDIFLGNEAVINVRSGGGGSITIKAQNVDFVGGSGLRAGISEGLGSPEAQGGDIEINAIGRINLADNSLIDNEVEENAVGKSGNVKIKTGSLSVNNASIIGTTISGEGTAGSVTIEASDAVVLDGVRDLDILTGVTSVVEKGAEGNGGVITITTGSLEVKNGAEILSINWGKGNAGTVNINATETVVLDGENSEFSTGVATSLEEGAEGKAGVLTITTGSLEVKNGAIIDSLTLGKGDAGAVNINAIETVVLDGENSEFATGVNSDVDTGAEGNAGGVTITTGSLEVKNGAVIGASTLAEGNAGGVTITTGSLEVKNGAVIAADTFAKGDAGTVNINATETVVLDRENSDFFTGVTSSVQSGAEGNAGGVTITTGSLEVKNGAQILASTFAKGDAGTVNINTTETVVLDGGDSEILTVVASGVARGAEGNAGGVTITTGSLEVKKGAQILASTFGKGDAGTVNINATETVVLDGGDSEILTGVASGVARGAEGNAGGVTITTGSLEVKKGAQILASTLPDSTGNGGDISINATKVTITNSSEIAVSSEGQGNGGNIFLSAGDLFLDRGSKVSAITASGQGGNMTFNIANLFSLRNNSPISTTAGGTGNGGNINLSTEFFLARDDSDITANAFEGNGGNISIATQGIFSFPNSTIDASSQLGIDGLIEINTPDIDPSQGLIKLSENVVDPDQLISQNACLQGEESEYIITGRGGLSPSPAQTLNSDPLEVGLVDTATGTAATVTPPPTTTSTAQIVPAKGWKLNEKGEVILVSYDPTNTRVQKHRANPATCQPR